MLTRIKKTVGEDDFSYFIRYFGLFTLIFSAMTLIIIQVMRSSLYTTVDENLKTLSQDPYSLVAIAYRDQRQSKDKDNDDDLRWWSQIMINQNPKGMSHPIPLLYCSTEIMKIWRPVMVFKL